MNDMNELIEAFRSEGEEIFERLEELLLQLEQRPDDEEVLNEIFRGAHTIKGNAACLQFDHLTAFAHVVEEMLERLRNGLEQATASRVSLLLESVDALRDLTDRAIAGKGDLSARQLALMDALTGSISTASASVTDVAQRTTHSLRVGIDKLNQMLDLTGEITTARGHVRQLAGSDERLLDAVREVDRLCFDLQELVMSARMVALAPPLRAYQRVVRDVAAAQQKQVALSIDVGDVEVDSTVVEQLRDPITHMLRNAIDHGIEMPEERLALGKSAAGTIHISASRDRNGIVIRVCDDGRGLDEETILRRAVERGFEPTLDVIFEPGFSTASRVTDISGRGVGMDVVRKNVEALRGSISIASEKGNGTAITIRLPLAVSVIEGFAVAAAGETYVLPIDSVAECMALPAEAGGGAFGILSVRGEVLPFVRLRDLFGLAGKAVRRENVIVLQHDHGRAGIVVDELLGASDVVMKPMAGMLRQLTGVAGSSVLGSGRVALVLDPREIVRAAIQSQLSASHA
jgi:two-component system, chemotaxis family, sensor kinase CheA